MNDASAQLRALADPAAPTFKARLQDVVETAATVRANADFESYPEFDRTVLDELVEDIKCCLGSL